MRFQPSSANAYCLRSPDSAESSISSGRPTFAQVVQRCLADQQQRKPSANAT
jgi:hypothetical protein